jgi:putative heme-binding domain-containing protein
MDRLLAEVASQGDPARGELVFRRKDLNCTGCHAVAGAGGNVGPDLSPIGSTSPVDYLVHSIMLPDQAIKEQYQTLVVATTEGEVYQGIVADRDDARIVLREATGDLRTVPTAQVEDQKPGGSLMPRGLVNLMTRAEFVDLVRFLAELGRPGPYAIRGTPTIQRWLAFTDVPDILRANRPESIQVHTELLNADPSRWTPAYSLVSGDLPLDDLKALAGGPVLYLMGEIDVTATGPITAHLDSPEGLTLWLDSRPVDLEGPTATIVPAEGRHRLVLRVDNAARPRPTLKLELTKPPASPAQFTVVGGK